uniref:Peptidase S1 domain-containing protein n=1 Tax=Leptobrachium leishanense TaxID=445787 RepID=A0A8C5WJD2_9ANUR
MMFSNVLSPQQLSTAHGVCGFPVISNRITWNTNTVEGEWPWQISIQYLGFHICGGSLISDRWILSAAYCFTEDANPLHYTVYLGAHDITGKKPYEQVRGVNKIILHPKYSGILSGGDIALVELLEPVHYSSKVLPVCLPAASVTFPCHSECWISGWANVYSRYNVRDPKTLQKVKVPMIDSERCDGMMRFDKSSKSKDNAARLMAEDTICFGYDEKHTDPCKVGAGDPLVCQVDGIWYQAGIIKWGIGCHSFDSSCPDTYTLVSSFQSWIRAHVPDIIFTVLANDPEADTSCKGVMGTAGDVTSCSGSPSSVQCGSPGITNHIADTTNAVDGEWPWQVAIQYNGSFICGGSLISEQWVLSAAHCFKYDYDPKNYTIITGVCQLSGHMPHAKHSAVMEIIWNPNHKAGGSRGDIALVKLSSPVSYTAYIKPICLPSASATFLPEMECWVTGWGALSSTWSPLFKSLQKVKLPLIDHKQCNQMYHNGSLESTFTTIIQNDKICAGYAERKMDTCQGDSGGPLVCKIKGQWIQAGIALKGKGCDSSNRPRVYTLVPAYVSWIKSYVPQIQFA